MFLIALGKRGESYGWNASLFNISNQEVGNPQDKNLLTQYGVLTLENCQAHATAYIGIPNRAAQASIMCLNAITASVGPDLMMKLVNRQEDYTLTANRVMDGTCMVYTLISCVVIHTRATISVIRAQLQSLPALMKQHKSNITNFNADVDDKITSLRAVDEGCQDLLSFLFAAYQTASDKEFREYIHDREVKWENNEIANMSVEDLMATAEGRYKVMVEKGVWAKPSREEADLMALAASIKQADATKTGGGGGKADTPRADRTGAAPRPAWFAANTTRRRGDRRASRPSSARRSDRHLGGGACVANVTCTKPAVRAASSTLTTDWCVAVASALMITTGSLAAPAAAFSASASAAVVV